ncbi:homoserine kinase [Nocardioides sp. Kera G14]|uniref:homoserine kinase n=1 Tax=Nocardioides sp. Kera G14 TaxID=2884264 RepID=UPI001D10A92B|nr:homoserine kinase [Nocardioides sp. Kera G14]UDY24718.1 homoserine kinase [Nocardioides sp. Kera G14]
MSDFVAGPVTVTVPATSANLGPGYDTLGLALEWRDTLTASVIASGLEVSVEGSGSDTVPLDETHLVIQSMYAAFDALGGRPHGLRLSCVNVIPHARGLGSSSAAIVGGLALARALVVDGSARLDDVALFELAASIEGHPDNVAPAVFGGLTISGHEGETFHSVNAPVAEAVGVVVFIPPTGVETKVARGLLPVDVPHAEAAQNSGNAALLVTALAGQPQHLHRATKDFLHQEYRRPAMPTSLAFVDELRADGVPAVVSGAGPTVLAFVTSPEDADVLLARCPSGWVARSLQVASAGVLLSP